MPIRDDYPGSRFISIPGSWIQQKQKGGGDLVVLPLF